MNWANRQTKATDPTQDVTDECPNFLNTPDSQTLDIQRMILKSLYSEVHSHLKPLISEAHSNLKPTYSEAHSHFKSLLPGGKSTNI